MSGNERTAILAVVAALGVGAVAVDRLFFQAAQPVVAEGEGDAAPASSKTVVVVPVGAPQGADYAALQKRYAALRLKQPFKERDFKDKPRALPQVPRAERRREEPTTPGQPKAPEPLDLRLTGLMGDGPARVGIFEQRGSGKAVFAHAGRMMGLVEVASIGSATVTVVDKGQRRELTLGDTLAFPASITLETLQPEGSRKEPEKKTVGADGKALPEISDKKKMSILERLKARRRKSLEAAADDGGKSDEGEKTDKTESGKTDESAKTESGKTEKNK
ncbi:MAG: hypothetical protein AB7N76_07525 [Planctomycetota bacterium]